MKVTIDAVAVKGNPKNFGSKTYWGVKIGGEWKDLQVNDQPVKGQTYEVTTEDYTSATNGKTYHRLIPVTDQLIKAVPTSSTPQRSTVTNRTTPYTRSKSDWEDAFHWAHKLVTNTLPPLQTPEPTINTLLIAFGDGKINLSEDWIPETSKKENDWPEGNMYAETPAHIELEDLVERLAKAKSISPTAALAEISQATIGKRLSNVREFQEKNAQDALPHARELIYAAKDWQVALGQAIKEYCVAKKIDYDSKKRDVLFEFANTKDLRQMRPYDAYNTLAKILMEIPK